MNNILYKIQCAVRRIFPETADEKDGKELLRSRIVNLPPLPSLDDSWSQHRSKIRTDILNRDPRTFLSWPYIEYTMFHQSKLKEFDELKQKPYWNEWKNCLIETGVGTPRTYSHFKVSSGNLIHHAYSLSQLKDYRNIDFSKLNTIVEFGGGYGSMARLVHNLGFRGTYIIFDLPEFLALQEYFLDRLNIKNIKYADSVSKLKETLRLAPPPELFIATWSLSEAPVILRDDVLKELPNIKYFLIAYQDSFEKIDNVGYFKKLVHDKKETEWKLYPILHLPGNNYLLGKHK